MKLASYVPLYKSETSAILFSY